MESESGPGRPIVWRVGFRSTCEEVFEAISSDAGRARFWAEKTEQKGSTIHFRFADGTRFDGEIWESSPPTLYRLFYAGADTLFELSPSSHGSGCVLTLTATGVAEDDWDDVHAGWVSVLLILKAAVDHGADLRTHDPNRAWPERYVNQ